MRPHRRILATPAASRLASRLARRGDQAFTLIEMVVSLAILGIAVGLISGLVVGITQQTSAERFSVQALSQAQLAGGTLVQYLRGATEILPTAPSSASAPVVASAATSTTDLTIVTTEGYNDSTHTAGSTTVCAQWLAAGAPGADAKFEVTFDCGTSNQRTVATYYALASQPASTTSPVFTYYEFNTTTNSLSPLSIANPVPACAIGEIDAVGIDVTFLAGPQHPTEGYAADESTTLDTIVYLHGDGLSGTGGSTTTTTSTTAACPE